MGQGIDKNAASEALSLEPSQLLEFYLIYYGWPDDQSSVLAICPFQGGGQAPRIIWQEQEYISIPIQVEGFSAKGDNTLPRPRIQIANSGGLISRYIKTFNNFVGVKIVRKRTFAKFLDGINFEGGENPYWDISTKESASSTTSYLPDQTFYINRRLAETKDMVEFELSTVFELDNVYIPNRTTYSRYCTWVYRGHGCRYDGQPKTSANSQPFTSSNGNSVSPTINKGLWNSETTYNLGEYAYLQIENYPLRADEATNLSAPAERLKTFYVCVEGGASGNEDHPPSSKKWQKDDCSKRISDCKLRYPGHLRFGGFPGTHEYAPKG